MRLIAAAFCVLFAAAVARASTPAECGAATAMSDEWPVSPPAQQGLDPELICATGPGLAKRTDAVPHGVVVARNGALVYERYFTTTGFAVPYDANTLHDIASITKGVVALLIGIALDRGLLIDLDAPIMSSFPEYPDLRTPEKDRITLRHLLTMTSGLSWPERAISLDDAANIVHQGASASDPYRFVLARPVETTPGTAWNYNSGGVWLLGPILRKVSGKPVEEFAEEALLEPLGIGGYVGRSSGYTPGRSMPRAVFTSRLTAMTRTSLGAVARADHSPGW
jgi:CubicO group peptidase (beta-lactamase class C family)